MRYDLRYSGIGDLAAPPQAIAGRTFPQIVNLGNEQLVSPNLVPIRRASGSKKRTERKVKHVQTLTDNILWYR
jgi:hypothetical protein